MVHIPVVRGSLGAFRAKWLRSAAWVSTFGVLDGRLTVSQDLFWGFQVQRRLGSKCTRQFLGGDAAIHLGNRVGSEERCHGVV